MKEEVKYTYNILYSDIDLELKELRSKIPAIVELENEKYTSKEECLEKVKNKLQKYYGYYNYAYVYIAPIVKTTTKFTLNDELIEEILCKTRLDNVGSIIRGDKIDNYLIDNKEDLEKLIQSFLNRDKEWNCIKMLGNIKVYKVSFKRDIYLVKSIKL